MFTILTKCRRFASKVVNGFKDALIETLDEPVVNTSIVLCVATTVVTSVLINWFALPSFLLLILVMGIWQVALMTYVLAFFGHLYKKGVNKWAAARSSASVC